MDDDDVQDTVPLDNDNAQPGSTSKPSAQTTADEAPPSKPPRPVSQQQKNEQTLREAFPTIDLSVIRAVLTASGGRIDPAFNALLGMSDPDAVQQEASFEPAPPPQPPRPARGEAVSQLEADERYARQLAEHYDNVGAYEARTSSRGQAPRRQATGLKPNEMYDREHSFLDDDLPVIRDNLRKGFQETQKTVNTWFTSIKKKIDDAMDEEAAEHERARQQDRMGTYGRREGEASRRSNDYDRYDADPQVLSDDFAGIRLHPDGTPIPNRTSSTQNVNRTSASVSPRPEGRKVAFKDGAEDIDAYDASPRVPPKDNVSPAPSGRQSKWQPLSTQEHNPVTENDPFSLGDSEDEKDTKDKGIKMEDSERLQQATADAMADSLVDSKPKDKK
ncbi:uncharacterized protein B0I36DRAFT_371265 [Microdochium trichocladiopsis]|uniref:CUE domain-containing protein n=1 Tax=Microdochium trichocladiopsis TaxID=1682393 RepID=A0A9P9BWM8_9PEZI|nr:uncharacterized protein B0I36DRAFT_371265 [Microdochium trichocladiopsis]KAH7040755.1 hypothetical protein B0I36DRAFT_371265 [Microdochium trichocladiopsis]